MQNITQNTQNTAHDFLELAFQYHVLQFGEFTLKSGRISPYFFNLGNISSGAGLARLGNLYAAKLLETGEKIDSLFGPAYKGIPLVASLAVALAGQGVDLPYAYNRKEAKTHGEGGVLVGAKPEGCVALIDDVMTAGTAIRQSLDILASCGATPRVVLLALDRQERGVQSDQSAVMEMRAQGLRVEALANLNDVLSWLATRPELAVYLPKVQAYRAAFGV